MRWPVRIDWGCKVVRDIDLWITRNFGAGSVIWNGVSSSLVVVLGY